PSAATATSDATLGAPTGLTFRTWRSRDVDALCRHANDRLVWRGLLDGFPNPYTEADAERWIALNHATLTAPQNFAIELDGKAIGGVGFDRRKDVFAGTAEIGYWVARAHWGKGIATAAARFISDYAFGNLPLARLQAGVFGNNPASVRVLEKAGYGFEGRLRNAVNKDGELLDLLMYARLREPA
ncbi:MAG TPA: GNAT family protein, partial [Polyangia bacterium]